ncbi:MAG: hypothetical protein K6G16_05020 [Lachnospiraceae bacterium]|nr:hypothetical protein [Lachnospiraceae bacterium]
MNGTDNTDRNMTNGEAPRMRCPSCGAEFDPALQSCPFCGHVNEKADEKGFYQDLQASEQAVREMVDIPEETATKEAKHAGRLIVIVLIVFAVLAILFAILNSRLSSGSRYHRDEQQDYLWLQEHLPEMQAAYDKGMESGDFSELLKIYDEGQQDGAPVWRFEHDVFLSRLTAIEQTIPGELEGAKKWQEGHENRYLTNMKLLFYDEMQLFLIPVDKSLSDEEKAYLQPLAEPWIEDLKSRYSLTDGELEGFRTDYETKGYLSYTDCEKFVEERMR